MERRIYTYQSNITPYYYPVKFEDVVIDEAQVPQDILDSVSKHWLISRDYGDVMINLTRMVSLVILIFLLPCIDFVNVTYFGRKTTSSQVRHLF